jgi:hypothetical protein
MTARQIRRAAERQALKQARKNTVSQNHTTHALNYHAATFRVLACENQADYNQLLKQLRIPVNHLHGPTPLPPRPSHPPSTPKPAR